jgi:hypothetical protein
MQLLAVAQASGLSRSELARQALHLFRGGHVNPLLTDTTKTAPHTPTVAPNRRAVELGVSWDAVGGSTPALLAPRTRPEPKRETGSSDW